MRIYLLFVRATCPSFFSWSFSACCFFFTINNYSHSPFNSSLSVSRLIHQLLNRNITCFNSFSIQRISSLNASLVFIIKCCNNHFRHFIDILQQVCAHAKAALVYVYGECLSRHLKKNLLETHSLFLLYLKFISHLLFHNLLYFCRDC
jgi:hypothetical protein